LTRAAVLKAYADVHVNAAIVQALRKRGMDVATAQERGQRLADDSKLLADALAEERVLLTNDTDFLTIAANYTAMQTEFAPIFFWPQQARTVSQVVSQVIQNVTQNDYAALCSRVTYL
jgi:hypothetical protein